MITNRILLTFFTFIFSLLSAQESFTMRYGCMQSYIEGNWGKTQKAFLQADFSVGTNKDIVLINKQGKNRFIRTAEPFVSETKSGMRYQVIPTVNKGAKYIFQYLENYNLRLIRVSDNLMIEYGCVQDFDDNAGTNHNLYSVISERAYFHNLPNKSTRRNGYLLYGEVIEGISEKLGYVYVIYVNDKGITSKGWILKSNLSKY